MNITQRLCRALAIASLALAGLAHAGGDTVVYHINENGSASFNLAVADSRIGAVASALKKLGIAAHQIQRSVRGDEEVPADCRSSECRRAMRRVDLVFSQGGSNR